MSHAQKVDADCRCNSNTNYFCIHHATQHLICTLKPMNLQKLNKSNGYDIIRPLFYHQLIRKKYVLKHKKLLKYMVLGSFDKFFNLYQSDNFYIDYMMSVHIHQLIIYLYFQQLEP